MLVMMVISKFYSHGMLVMMVISANVSDDDLKNVAMAGESNMMCVRYVVQFCTYILSITIITELRQLLN